MPGVDWIPGISQLKSLVQEISGDREGARETQENFIRECPIASQITSLVQFAGGDEAGALETQKRCLGTINEIADSVPVIGHIKGAVHHIAGDHDGGNKALNAATRTTVVAASAAATAVATGGIAAIPVAISTGMVYDTTATIITNKPQGSIAEIRNIIEKPSISTDAVEEDFCGGANENDVEDVTGNMTSQFRIIKHGIREFWINQKTGQINVSSSSNSNITVPVIGYYGDKELSGFYDRLAYLSDKQENALFSDSYIKVQSFEQNRQSREEALNNFEKQTPNLETIQDIYPKIQISMKVGLDEPLHKSQKTSLLCVNLWLHVRMPKQFYYTGLIMFNSVFQGLLHSFIRHGHRWSNFISIPGDMLETLSLFNDHLKDARVANDPEDASIICNRILETCNKLDDDECISIQRALHNIQCEIYEFIQRNVAFENHLGETISMNGKQQVYFKIKDKNGQMYTMVICVSDQLYPSDESVSDLRPIRTITTVFFISWEEHLKKVLKVF